MLAIFSKNFSKLYQECNGLEPLSLQSVGWLVECCFTSTETVGLLGTGAQGVHLDFHTAPELWKWVGIDSGGYFIGSGGYGLEWVHYRLVWV